MDDGRAKTTRRAPARHQKPPEDGGSRVNQFAIKLIQQSTHGVGLIVTNGNDEFALAFMADNDEAHDIADPLVRILERSQWWYRNGYEALRWTDGGEAVLGAVGLVLRQIALVRQYRQQAPVQQPTFQPQYQPPSRNGASQNGYNVMGQAAPDTQAQRASANGNGASESGYLGPQPVQPGQQVIAPGYFAE